MMDKFEGIRLRGITKSRWHCNTEIILINLGSEVMNQIQVASEHILCQAFANLAIN
jgi:hypothetical protein